MTVTHEPLHHKYALLDAERANWDGVVITGSHNWSSSAETANNVNTGDGEGA